MKVSEALPSMDQREHKLRMCWIKFAFPALGYIFLKVISLVRPSVSLSLD